MNQNKNKDNDKWQNDIVPNDTKLNGSHQNGILHENIKENNDFHWLK
jgi:hypothetical protein